MRKPVSRTWPAIARSERGTLRGPRRTEACGEAEWVQVLTERVVEPAFRVRSSERRGTGFGIVGFSVLKAADEGGDGRA